MTTFKKMQRPAGLAFAGAAVLALGVGLATPAHAADATTNVTISFGNQGATDSYAPTTPTKWTVVLNGDEANAKHIETSEQGQMVVFSNMPVGQSYTAEVRWDNETPKYDCQGSAVAQPVDSNPAVEGKDYQLKPVTVFYGPNSCVAQ